MKMRAMPNFCSSECAACVLVSSRSHWRRIAERVRSAHPGV